MQSSGRERAPHEAYRSKRMGLSRRLQPQPRRRVVEHPHPARRHVRFDPLRRILSKPWHRVEHAHPTTVRLGRQRSAGSRPVQPHASPIRIRPDRCRLVISSSDVGSYRMGERAPVAGGERRSIARQGDGASRADRTRRPGHLVANHAGQSCSGARACRGQVIEFCDREDRE